MTAVPAAAVPSELRGGLILASDGAGISVVLPIPRVPRVPGRGRYPCAQRICPDLPARSVGGVQTELKPRALRAGATTGSPDDRVAVVTGGASGIGLTTVRPAAAEPPGGNDSARAFASHRAGGRGAGRRRRLHRRDDREHRVPRHRALVPWHIALEA